MNAVNTGQPPEPPVNVPSACKAADGKAVPVGAGVLAPSGARAAGPLEIQGKRTPARSKNVIFGRCALFSRRAMRTPTCDVALRMVQRTERALGLAQRPPSRWGRTLAAMRFLGTSISTLRNGPSAHEPVILTSEPTLAALPDHLRLHANAEVLLTELG